MRYGSKVLFEDVTTTFARGRRYGLTGPNGAGQVHFHEAPDGRAGAPALQNGVNGPANRLVSGRSAVLELIRQAPRESFDRTIEYLRVDGDFGIIMGAETVRPIGDAPLAGPTVRRRFTNIWRKEAGTWRMVARHASVIAPN